MGDGLGLRGGAQGGEGAWLVGLGEGSVVTPVAVTRPMAAVSMEAALADVVGRGDLEGLRALAEAGVSLAETRLLGPATVPHTLVLS